MNSPDGRKALVAKAVFWIGTIGDGLIAIEWFLICFGVENLPVLPGFFVGHGPDYRFAMGVGAIFMLAWTFLLYWGSRRPIERRGLLLLTAIFLYAALLLEIVGSFTIFPNMLTRTQIVAGAVVKLYLVIQFGFAYWYSDSHE
ncbi:MAG: hypothetical protein WC889_12315 [Myxococcota bacterium]|jgi:hypothetical protein